MLQLISLKVCNFLSFGNQVTEFDLGMVGTVQVNGYNIDADSRNGVGKTSLLNAISFALYGKPISSIAKDRLINATNGMKNTQMELWLKFKIGADVYDVHRLRGKKFGVNVYVNGDMDNPITPDSMTNADKFIEDLIGISFELFRKAVVFTGNSISFFEMPLSQQRDTIEELLKISELSKKADLLKDQIRDTEKDVAIEEALINQSQLNNSKIASRRVEIEQKIADWNASRERNVTALAQQIVELEAVDFDAEFTKLDQVSQLYTDIAMVKTEIKNVGATIVKLEKELKTVDGEIGHLANDECPYCHQHYVDNSKLSELHQASRLIDGELAAQRIALSEFVTVQSDLEQRVKGITVHFTDKVEAVKAQANINTLRAKLEEMGNAKNPHEASLNELQETVASDLDFTRLDELKNVHAHQKFLLKLLTDKNSFVRKKIINRTIPFMNRQLTHYLRELGLPHNVTFNSDMSATITEYGRELDYGNLSGGERVRLNLSLSLTFRDVMQHLHASINVLFTDEIDGGAVDEAGIEAIIRLIKFKARQDNIGIWVISHRPEMKNRFNREIKLVKENGFTRVESVVDLG